MMAGLFDLLQGAMGRPDPRQQLASALGQGPGQPGSPAGPQPLAGAAGAPPAGGAPPAAPGDPQGGPQQQQQQAPPQPQVYQSPPDLTQMYMALSQRDQASNQFYNGLALLSAGMYPGRNPNASMRWAQGMQQDPNSTMNSLMQIQQYSQQNQALQAFQRSIPDLAKQTGMSEDQVRALGPQGASEVMSKIAEANAGVGGGPAWMARRRAEKALIRTGQAIPHGPPAIGVLRPWSQANTGQTVTTAKTKADDLVADQHNSPRRSGNYDKALGLSTSSIRTSMQGGREEIPGHGRLDDAGGDDGRKGKGGVGALLADHGRPVLRRRARLQGTGRITQSELTPETRRLKARWGN